MGDEKEDRGHREWRRNKTQKIRRKDGEGRTKRRRNEGRVLGQEKRKWQGK